MREIIGLTQNMSIKPAGPDDTIQLSPRLTRNTSPTSINPLPARLTSSITRLGRHDHAILVKKQAWLQNHTVTAPSSTFTGLTNPSAGPVAASLVFAQEEAGTAVCISSDGLLLTCAHCVAEEPSDLDWSQQHWLLFTSGIVVAAETVCWDGTRDLALLRIVKASRPPQESPSSASSPFSFPYVELAGSPPKPSARLVCIGHPGAEDLESSEPGMQTGYDVLVLSTGTFRGLAPDSDPQDNADIGALMHSCWTYWGHSGAPLLLRREGVLVGLHSSWDDETGMRRGVHWEAIRAFVDAYQDASGTML